jgi:hypothetical protein
MFVKITNGLNLEGALRPVSDIIAVHAAGGPAL